MLILLNSFGAAVVNTLQFSIWALIAKNDDCPPISVMCFKFCLILLLISLNKDSESCNKLRIQDYSHSLGIGSLREIVKESFHKLSELRYLLMDLRDQRKRVLHWIYFFFKQISKVNCLKIEVNTVGVACPYCASWFGFDILFKFSILSDQGFFFKFIEDDFLHLQPRVSFGLRGANVEFFALV